MLCTSCEVCNVIQDLIGRASVTGANSNDSQLDILDRLSHLRYACEASDENSCFVAVLATTAESMGDSRLHKSNQNV